LNIKKLNHVKLNIIIIIIIIIINPDKQVKQSRYRPGVALRVPGS